MLSVLVMVNEAAAGVSPPITEASIGVLSISPPSMVRSLSTSSSSTAPATRSVSPVLSMARSPVMATLLIVVPSPMIRFPSPDTSNSLSLPVPSPTRIEPSVRSFSVSMMLSTYILVAASWLATGSVTLEINEELTSTIPVPLGSSVMFPFPLVEEMVLASI